MPTAVRFYRDVLGFELVNQSRDGDDFDWCLLSRSGAEIMLNTMYEREHRPPQPDPKRKRRPS
jgi:glyoxylase I family protein